MPDAEGNCTFCHHGPMHHVWPGCDFPDRREIELAPGAWIQVPTCGCTGFDQPGEMKRSSYPKPPANS